ncbi:tRNA (cytosine(72)-C(5))-methyltransferase NSUN6-like [Saccoglossus kowalevskii]|uniref:Methyltransferase NSUN6-like n=1 Tax=Saccoglossus kowalevskii TaxID=10224 RepID=A0ABM0MFM4_SACKO|nr:PREDICTED: putative methyltransferase NSUN6-like [Saccoglossus kowalevskii]
MQRPLPPLRLKQEVEQYLKEIYCNQQIVEQLGKECSDTRFTDLLSKLSTPPCNTVARVNTLHYTREDVRQQLQQVVAEQYQQKCYDCPVVEPHPVLGDTLVILSDGPNVDMQRHDKEVIVSALCGNAVLRGADVFIPGIMAAHPCK